MYPLEIYLGFSNAPVVPTLISTVNKLSLASFETCSFMFCYVYCVYVPTYVHRSLLDLEYQSL